MITQPKQSRKPGEDQMTPDKITTAQHMYNTKTHTIAAIADTIGVSRATIYRHLNTPTTTTPSKNSKNGGIQREAGRRHRCPGTGCT